MKKLMAKKHEAMGMKKKAAKVKKDKMDEAKGMRKAMRKVVRKRK